MIKKLGIITVLVLSCFACGKATDYVPNVSISFQMALADPRLAALHNTNGAVIVNGYGVAGLIIYREADGSYAAYDRCSAYLPQNKCAVTLDNPSFTVTDPCSGSKWSLEDGSPVKAPAIKSLKAYAVNTNGFEIFVQN
jgi:nitrite reductase/ring-hydroxylating ferredoxin subunit